MKKYFDFGDTGILLTVCKIQTAQISPTRPIMIGSNFCEHCKNNKGHGFDDGGDFVMCSATTGGER